MFVSSSGKENVREFYSIRAKDSFGVGKQSARAFTQSSDHVFAADVAAIDLHYRHSTMTLAT